MPPTAPQADRPPHAPDRPIGASGTWRDGVSQPNALRTLPKLRTCSLRRASLAAIAGLNLIGPCCCDYPLMAALAPLPMSATASATTGGVATARNIRGARLARDISSSAMERYGSLRDLRATPCGSRQLPVSG